MNNLPHFGLNGPQHQGLNGFFGRYLKKLIVTVATAADSILNNVTGGLASQVFDFSNLAEQIGSGTSPFWNKSNNTTTDDTDPRGMYEPTVTEGNLLDEFAKQFAPILADIALQASTIQNENNPDNKINIANLVIRRINVILWYYKKFEIQGLSPEAIALKNYSIELLTNPVLANVATSMSDIAILGQSMVTTIWTGTANKDLQPVKDFTITTDQQVYFTGYYRGAATQVPTLENPPKQDIPPIPTIPVNTDPVPVQTTAPPLTKPGTKNYNWLWLLAVTYVGYRVVKSK